MSAFRDEAEHGNRTFGPSKDSIPAEGLDCTPPAQPSGLGFAQRTPGMATPPTDTDPLPVGEETCAKARAAPAYSVDEPGWMRTGEESFNRPSSKPR